MGNSLHHGRVVNEESTSHGVPGNIKTGNRISLRIKRLAIIVVNHKTTHHHKNKRLIELESVIGALLKRKQSGALFAEVGINALTC